LKFTQYANEVERGQMSRGKGHYLAYITAISASQVHVKFLLRATIFDTFSNTFKLWMKRSDAKVYFVKTWVFNLALCIEISCIFYHLSISPKLLF